MQRSCDETNCSYSQKESVRASSFGRHHPYDCLPANLPSQSFLLLLFNQTLAPVTPFLQPQLGVGWPPGVPGQDLSGHLKSYTTTHQ